MTPKFAEECRDQGLSRGAAVYAWCLSKWIESARDGWPKRQWLSSAEEGQAGLMGDDCMSFAERGKADVLLHTAAACADALVAAVAVW
jgi:hypothetical protein